MPQVEESQFYYTLTAVALLLVIGPWIGSLILIGKVAVDEPWWQQNRRVFSYRVFTRFYVVVVVILGISAVSFALKFDHSPNLIIGCGLGMFVLAALSYKACWLYILKRLGRKISLSLWTIWGQLVFLFISSSTLLFTILGMTLVPDKFVWQTYLILALLMGGMIAWHFHFAVGFLKWARVLVPAPRYVVETVRQLAMDQKFSPLPEVWELRLGIMNAFAFQVQHAICFTSAAREQLTELEIRSVAMHEMGHLAEPRLIRFLRQLSPVCFFPLLLFKPFGALDLGWFTTLMILVLVMFVLLQLYGTVQRRMETQADNFATATESDEEVQAYGGALIKLHKNNLIPAVLPGTHPHLYDRLESIGYNPDFPRPEAPKKLPGVWLGFIYTVVVIIVSFGLLWWPSQ